MSPIAFKPPPPPFLTHQASTNSAHDTRNPFQFSEISELLGFLGGRFGECVGTVRFGGVWERNGGCDANSAKPVEIGGHEDRGTVQQGDHRGRDEDMSGMGGMGQCWKGAGEYLLSLLSVCYFIVFSSSSAITFCATALFY